MIQTNSRKKTAYYITVIALTAIFAVLEFMAHRQVPFVKDDIWYMHNIAGTDSGMTNTASLPLLTSFKDIWESQVWHYFNWGGRSINHALLQMVLMTGEVSADIINMLMTALLCVIICKISGVKDPVFYILANVLMISLNPEVVLGMLWQSGCANYLYPSVWILFFAFVYLRELPKAFVVDGKGGCQTPSLQPEHVPGKKLPLIEIWIIPLGIMAGWSNENMGPAVFATVLLIILYLKIFCKKNPKVWMLEGAFFSLAGSIMLLIAPGNSVRKTYSESGKFQMLLTQLKNWLTATGEYLFPVMILAAAVLFVCLIVFKMKFKPLHAALIIFALLSHGAMILSPTYPARAVFGPMVILICLIISLLGDIRRECLESGREKLLGFLYFAYGCQYISAVLILAEYVINPPL